MSPPEEFDLLLFNPTEYPLKRGGQSFVRPISSSSLSGFTKDLQNGVENAMTIFSSRSVIWYSEGLGLINRNFAYLELSVDRMLPTEEIVTLLSNPLGQRGQFFVRPVSSSPSSCFTKTSNVWRLL